jgi:putative endonuclease
MNKHRRKGNQAENLALDYLTNKGLTLISRNFSSRFGEIDLIMLGPESLVFIEVKMRTRNDFGTGTEAVTIEKQRKIIKTAHVFLQKNPKLSKKSCRFDVVSILPPTIQWIKQAFSLTAH